eukprot:scaffold8904_cov104-Skeletonema_dohrnii-CCMP3373.AAC.2
MSMSESNYQVEIDHAKEGAFDVEQVNFDPPSSVNREDGISINSFEGEEDANAEEGDAPPVFSLKKKLCTVAVGCTLVVGATIAGVSVHSANKYRYVQSQKSNSLSSSDMSKSGKAAPVPPYCSSSKQTCGQTVPEGDKITLKEDLFCAEDWQTATKGQNCAITLEGNAELDCDGYTISQNTTLGSDAAVKCDDTVGNSRQQKLACQLYYYRGVCLTGAAKMKNCQVEKFLEGIYVENSGDIKDSIVSRNRAGIAVKDDPVAFLGYLCAGAALLSSRIVRDNAEGIDVNKGSTGNKISINQVRSNNNVGLFDSNGDNLPKYGSGMTLYGEEITVKDSEASSNYRNGIIIDGAGTTTVDLKGSIALRNNGAVGLLIDNIDNVGPLDGTLNVDGVVNIYENGSNGFSLLSGTNLDVEVKKGSSLIACENGSIPREKDIRNDGGGTFSDDGFICDDTRGNGARPNCENDCPACPV